MIRYHGTPIGGPKQDASRFLIGRHALVPFTYPSDLGAVMEYCQSFILDNGAFTIWKNGGTLDVDGYKEWVRDVIKHPGFDWALIPDVIDGTEAENDSMIEDWIGSGLYCFGVPVWHMHESFSRLESLCSKFRRIAIGSSGQWPTPGAHIWWERMADIMRVLCDDNGRPKVKIHGLRMMDPDIFSRIPLSSADSTNAAVNSGSISRFGGYVPPTAWQRASVIAARIEMAEQASVWKLNNIKQESLFDEG